jgi:hypothetical protein
MSQIALFVDAIHLPRPSGQRKECSFVYAEHCMLTGAALLLDPLYDLPNPPGYRLCNFRRYPVKKEKTKKPLMAVLAFSALPLLACAVEGELEVPARGSATAIESDSKTDALWQQGSCSDVCGKEAVGFGCFCDLDCGIFGDCCSDFSLVCKSYGKAEDKRDRVWQDWVLPSEYIKLPAFPPAKQPSAAHLKAKYLRKTFDHRSDKMPKGRRKFIHAFGVVAPIEFRPASAPSFTGLYQSGAIGLLRLSVVDDPNAIGLVPGAAIKLYVDGQASKNILTMHSLEGQGDNRNFFFHTLRTRIAPPKQFSLLRTALAFNHAVPGANNIPVAGLATVTRDGHKVAKPVAPVRLRLEPTKSVRKKISKNSKRDFRTDLMLAKIKVGTTIWRVYEDRTVGPTIHVGDIVLQDRFVASSYGDTELFFQHPRR